MISDVVLYLPKHASIFTAVFLHDAFCSLTFSNKALENKDSIYTDKNNICQWIPAHIYVVLLNKILIKYIEAVGYMCTIYPACFERTWLSVVPLRGHVVCRRQVLLLLHRTEPFPPETGCTLATEDISSIIF